MTQFSRNPAPASEARAYTPERLAGMLWTGKPRSFSQRMAFRTSRLRYAAISFQDSRRLRFGGVSLAGTASSDKCSVLAGAMSPQINSCHFPSLERAGAAGYKAK